METQCNEVLFDFQGQNRRDVVAKFDGGTITTALYWLDRTGYNGWLSMDQYPYREDAVGAISESIEWLIRFDSILQAHKKTIDVLLEHGDAVETSRFVRRQLFEQSVRPL
jgi:xylose isomerase